MNLRILYHGNCFDGVSSAAIFTKFYRTKINPDANVFYTPTMHRAGNAFDREQFDGDENAIVDFKYCADDRLTWWFDHHQSAFLSEDDEQHFLADTSGKKFLDTKSASCAEFIARIAKDEFGFEDPSLADSSPKSFAMTIIVFGRPPLPDMPYWPGRRCSTPDRQHRECRR